MGTDTKLEFDAKIDTSLFDKVTRQIFNYWFRGDEPPGDENLPSHPFFEDMWERVGCWSYLHYEEVGAFLFLRFGAHPKNWMKESASHFADWMSQFIPLEETSRTIIGYWGIDEYDDDYQDPLLVHIDFDGNKKGLIVNKGSAYVVANEIEIKKNKRTEAQKAIIEVMMINNLMDEAIRNFANDLNELRISQHVELARMYLELTGETM